MIAVELNLITVSVLSPTFNLLKYPSFDLYLAVVGHDLLHASPSDVTEAKGINVYLPEVYPRIPLCQCHNYIIP